MVRTTEKGEVSSANNLVFMVKLSERSLVLKVTLTQIWPMKNENDF